MNMDSEIRFSNPLILRLEKHYEKIIYIQKNSICQHIFIGAVQYVC
jgi:hypothetical protein